MNHNGLFVNVVSQVRASTAAAGVASTSTSAIRLTIPQVRQRSPVAASAPQVLKVMGTQAGSVPQIITLASARASGIVASVRTFLFDLWTSVRYRYCLFECADIIKTDYNYYTSLIVSEAFSRRTKWWSTYLTILCGELCLLELCLNCKGQWYLLIKDTVYSKG